MRVVIKRGLGPHQLHNAHSTPPATSAQATSRWRGFNHKPLVLEYLTDEQYGLCCYSEIRPDRVGLGFHIEHVENKSQNPQRTFSYDNLAASALNSENDLQSLRAQQAEIFGGHAPGKSSAVDMARFISCHQRDGMRYFAYLSDGRVVPADGLSLAEKDRAGYTITLLNLNSPYLVDLRQQWWEELEELFDQHIDQEMDLLCLAGIDLVPMAGRLSQFFSITRAFFGPIAEQVLDQQARQLR